MFKPVVAYCRAEEPGTTKIEFTYSD